MSDGVQSLITQVSRDDRTPAAVPIVRQPPPPRKKGFFERICGCCFSGPRDQGTEDGIAMTQTTTGTAVLPGVLPKQPAKPKALVRSSVCVEEPGRGRKR